MLINDAIQHKAKYSLLEDLNDVKQHLEVWEKQLAKGFDALARVGRRVG